MPPSAGKFDAALEAWQRWQDSPGGRLRYTLAEANLVRHTGPGPHGGGPALRVLDLAGADGGDALWLARRGHHVTIADFAPAMLARARERARAAGVGHLLATVEADVLELPEELTAPAFDLVVCHNLLQYLDETAPALRAALAPLRPGGLISVMAFNRHSGPLDLVVRAHDPAAALAALGTRHGRTRTFDTEMTLHTAEEVRPVLTSLGCTGVRHYGIRAFCDFVTDEERRNDPDFFADLERLELAVTDRPPYPHLARIFQLVARKAT
ncbi:MULTISPECIES: methyltransferase domain-containing protein [Streptomyces]|uniref:Methyltransferase domain-containing protein n=1 Tax=Streptomyces lycii TaxID=2654337 RepID=A0ABQ7FH26_9ACTN|nr:MULTISPECIES: methyltransferase domain-containing protein [Streptomyces]KAF4407263.1 methyltransferase domain-containing protein [Streptomyces lycii]PGH50918.1 SAM-dependent methyltransferase [Streptomyces sp. Ru87]